jgi:hypothetical protein
VLGIAEFERVRRTTVAADFGAPSGSAGIAAEVQHDGLQAFLKCNRHVSMVVCDVGLRLAVRNKMIVQKMVRGSISLALFASSILALFQTHQEDNMSIPSTSLGG